MVEIVENINFLTVLYTLQTYYWLELGDRNSQRI